MTTDNKRQQPRVEHAILTELDQGVDSRQLAQSLDFSESGIRLALTHPVAVNEPLALRLNLPLNATESQALDVTARVVWQRAEGGQLRCGAEFLGLSGAQKRRLKQAFGFARHAMAASIAGLLLNAAPALAITPSYSMNVPGTAAGSALTADVLNAQKAFNAASVSLQQNLGSALQDVLKMQKNASGSNILNMMYQASLATKVAKLGADAVALKNATEKLGKLTQPTITAHGEALRQATANYNDALKTGNVGNINASKQAMDQALMTANGYVASVFGNLLPSVTDQVQADIGNLAKGVVELGKQLINKDAKGVEASKAALNDNLTRLAENYVAMTQTPSSPPSSGTQATVGQTFAATTETAQKPEFMETVTGVVESLDKVQVKQADGTTTSAAQMIGSFLAGLIKSPAVQKASTVIPSLASLFPQKAKLVDGSELAYMDQDAANPAASLGFFGLNPDATSSHGKGYAMLTDRDGNVSAIGFGHSSQFSYAKALFGDDDLAQLSDQMGVANLSDVAKGGGMLAYGTRLNADTRIAASWTDNRGADQALGVLADPATEARASNLGFGIAHRLSEELTLGANVGLLHEKHGLLGTTYSAGSMFSFGDSNRTVTMGLSAAYKLDKDNSLLAEASFARTRGGNSAGLIADTSAIQSRSWGITYSSKNLVSKGDGLSVSVIKPMHVVAGQVAIATAQLDAQGTTVLGKEWVSLTPSGSETQYRLAYDTPLKDNQSLSFQASARKDMQNVAGQNEVAAGVAWKMRF